jgi:hypothetical protein
MLSKPYSGWSDFKLEGTSTYSLSYLDDIAFEWLDEAIHGLKTRLPFCVKGFMEPNRFLCMVSYYSCYIVIEDEWVSLSNKEAIIVECSPTTMVDFCKYLHKDISEYLDEWAEFYCSCIEDDEDEIDRIVKVLREKLDDLQKMIIVEENRKEIYL